MLRDLRVASPCSADWEEMTGDDRVRYCSQCNLNVYNFAAMTAPELEQLVVSHEGRLCGRLYRRKDGTVLTRDCPIGFRAIVRRVSRIAGTALSAAMSLSVAVAQNSGNTASLVQIDLHEASLTVVIADPSGAVIAGARVLLVNQATQSKSTDVTGPSGRVQFSNLGAGSYRLTAEAPNFTTVTKTVELPGQKAAEIRLDIASQSMMGVVVGGDIPAPEPIPIPLPDQIPATNTETSSPTSNPALHRTFFQKLTAPFRHL